MKTIKDLEKLLSKFKNSYKNHIFIRYIHDEIDEIEKEISYLQENTISIDDQHLAIVTNNFDEFIANNSDEEIEELIEKNIEIVGMCPHQKAYGIYSEVTTDLKCKTKVTPWRDYHTIYQIFKLLHLLRD